MRELLAAAGDRGAASSHFVSGMGAKERSQLRRMIDPRLRR